MFSFNYKVKFDNDLTENEHDHVFVGGVEGELKLNPEEVRAVRYVDAVDLKFWIASNANEFTPWFLMIMERLEQQKETLYG